MAGADTGKWFYSGARNLEDGNTPPKAHVSISWPVHIGKPWEEGNEGISGSVQFLRSALGCLDAVPYGLHHVDSLLHPQFHC